MLSLYKIVSEKPSVFFFTLLCKMLWFLNSDMGFGSLIYQRLQLYPAEICYQKIKCII
jgi:hypothetical protein